MMAAVLSMSCVAAVNAAECKWYSDGSGYCTDREYNPGSGKSEPALIGLGFEFAGRPDVTAAGGSSMKATQSGVTLYRSSLHEGKDMGFMAEFNYTRLDVKKLGLLSDDGQLKTASNVEALIGARYYPVKATFKLGDVPVRLTASALAGLGIAGESTELRTLFTAGLAAATSLGGFSLEAIYRPAYTYKYNTASFTDASLDVGGATGLRVVFLFQ